MSSGHTGRPGRGNRRARRGSQRQRSPEGQNNQNNQTRSNSAMLLVSHTERQSPIPEPRAMDPGALDEAFDDAPGGVLGGASDEDEEAETEGEIEAEAVEVEVTEVIEFHEATGEAQHEAQPPEAASAIQANAERTEMRSPAPMPPANGHRGAVPYAPGMRTHMSPPQVPGNAGRSGQPEQNGQHDSEPVTRTPAAPLPRTSRFERDRSERGEREPMRPEVRGEVGPLIDALHDIFAQDRTVASQGGTTRCGICYLHFPVAELEYREAEGYYVCERCARALGQTRLPMVRRQQRS